MKHLGTRLRVISLLVLLSAFFGLLTTDKASAIFPNDRSAKYGYFTGDYFDWNTTAQKNVLPSASDDMARYVCGNGNTTDGQAIPSCIDNVAELVRFLKKRNDIESTSSYYRQMTTGSAFIVYTMLGYGSADYDRVIPQNSSLWDELTDRLNASTIKWSGNVSSSINTIWRYTSSRNDVVWYDDYVSGPGILITSPSSGESYRLLRGCANPIGELAPLEKAKAKTWAIKPSITIYVDKDADETYEESTSSGTISVPIGAKLYWKSSIENTGEGETTQGIEYGYTKSGNDAWSGSAPYSTNVMLGIGKEVSSTSGRLKVVADDAGNTFCELTYARPKSSSSGGTINSAAACIKVKDITWSITPSTTVKVDDGHTITSKTATDFEQTIYSVPINSTVSWTSAIKKDDGLDKAEDITFGYIGWSGSGSYGSFDLVRNEEVSSVPGDHPDTDIRIITSDDAGKTFCKLTYAQPGSSSSGDTIKSAKACIKVKDITWSITPSTTVKVDDGHTITSKTATTLEKTIDQVPIGSIVSWTSTIKNNGPNNATSDIKYRYHNDSFLEDRAGTEYGNIKNVGMLDADTSDSIDSYLIGGTTFEIETNDAGKKFCRSTKVWPTSSTNSDDTESEYACIKVAYDYNLIPTIAFNPAITAFVPGDTPKVQLNMGNSGTTNSENVEWQVTRLIEAPTYYPSRQLSAGTSLSGPASYYSGWDSNTKVKSGNRVFDIPSNIGFDLYQELAANTMELSSGTLLCYALSVSPYSQATGQWRHSAPVCIIAGKRPKVQVWGGDVRTTQNVDTSLSNDASNIYGSWSEYGILASGTINGMASGSVLAGLGSPSFCQMSVLSFTNAALSTCTLTSAKGSYNFFGNQPDVAASYPISAATPTFPGAGIYAATTGIYIYKATGPITVSAGTIVKGRSVVINAGTNNVTIDGDIFYQNDVIYNDIKELPQLVIIAANIDIKQGVKNIDGWLVAKNGTIDTCSDVPSLLISNCTNQLIVNGPVIANHLKLRRTYGSDGGIPATKGAPAEIINLRADSYLWAASQATSSNRMQTVYTTELPPRF